MRKLLFFAVFLLIAPAAWAQSPITAREHLPAVIQAARHEDPSAQLLAVSADDIDRDTGTSASWTYLFGGSDSTQSIVALQRGANTSTTAATFESDTLGPAFSLRGFTPAPVQQEWIDGDRGWFGIKKALDRAEAGGGDDFRSNHLIVTISARLASIPTELVSAQEGMVTAWLITYSARNSDEFQVFAVEADGGNVLPLFDAPRSFAFQKAKISEFSARQVAKDSLNTNAVRLATVATVVPDLNGRGESVVWRYTFYAPGQDAFRDVYVLYGSVVTVTESRVDPFSKQALPSEWIDSDSAMAVATDTLFREEPGVLAQAYLTRGLFPNDTARAAWKIDVMRPLSDTSGTAYVNALTGALLDAPVPDSTSGPPDTTGTERQPPRGTPHFTVSAPTPNPFRRNATLHVTLPVPADVTVSIFDAMGRRVRHHSLGSRSAGTQRVRINGDGLAAGVYVYRITARSGGRTRVATARMVHVQ